VTGGVATSNERWYALRRLEVGGHRLEVFEPAFDGASPEHTVVFLHGMEGSWSIWDPVAWQLRFRVRALCVELPWSSAHSGRDWAMSPGRWLHAIFRALALERFTVVAHSFGANALLAYLDRYGAARLESLVCVCPFYQDSVEKFDWSTLTYFVEQFHGFMREGILAREPAYTRSAVVDLMATRVREKIGPEGWLQFFGLFCRTPRLDLSHIDQPALVVAGSEDIASRPRYSRELAAAFPRGDLRVFEGGRHFPMLERPEEFAAVLQEFLGRPRPVPGLAGPATAAKRQCSVGLAGR
jgi:pimeloyl-ACP methyl ester carboxylesterase